MCLSIPMIEIKTHHKYKYELTDRQHLNSSLPLHNISPDKSNINSAGLPAILAACQPVEGNRHIHTLPLRFMTPYSAHHGTSDTPDGYFKFLHMLWGVVYGVAYVYPFTDPIRSSEMRLG